MSGQHSKKAFSKHFPFFLRTTVLILALLFGCGIAGYSYVGNWYSQGSADAGTPGNWNSSPTGAGVTATASDFTTAGNTWNIQSAMILSENWTVAGNIVITPTGNFNPSSMVLLVLVQYNVTLGGSWTNNGAFTCGTGTVTFNGTTGGNTLSGSLTGSNAFYNITFNGSGSWSFGANAADVANNFTITTGNITAPSTTLQIAGNFVRTSGTFSHNNGTVSFNGTGAQSLPSTATTYYNLNIANTGGTVTANAAMTINNTLTSVAGASLNMGTFQLLGTLNASGFGGTLSTQCGVNPGIPNNEIWGGTVNYNASTATQYIAYGTYNNLSVTTTTGAHAFDGAVTVNGNLSISATTGATSLGGALTVAGNLSLNGTTNNNIFSVTGSNYQVNVGGNWTVSSTTATSLFNAGTGKVVFNGTGAQIISSSGGSALPNFYNIENSNTTNTVAINSNATITGTVTNDANATLSFGAPTVNIAGSWTNNGAFASGTGTVVFNSATSGNTLSGNMTGSNAFYNLTFNTSGGSWSFGSNAADVNGTLTLGTGTLIAPSSNLNIGTAFVHNGGTFTNNSGTVTFNGTGAETFPGTAVTSFYNLSVANTTNTVTATANFTATGSLTGLAGSFLNMSTYQLSGLSSAAGFNGTLQTQNTANPPLPNGIIWGGTVIYASATATAGVPYGTYNNLTINTTTSNRTFTPGVTVVNGNMNVSSTSGIVTLGGTLVVAGNLSINGTSTANIFDVSSSNYQISVGGNWTQSSTGAVIPFNTRAVRLFLTEAVCRLYQPLPAQVHPHFIIFQSQIHQTR